MIKLMVFQSFETPQDLCMKVSEQLGIQIIYISTKFKYVPPEEYSGYYKLAVDEKVDAIVASYYDYSTLIRCFGSIPVIPLNFSNWETLGILQSLKKNVVATHIPHPKKIALVTAEELLMDIGQLSDIFQLDIHNVIRSGNTVPDSFFQELKEEGFEVVACSPTYHDQVVAAGMYHAFDPDSHSYYGLLGEFRHIMQLLSMSNHANKQNRVLNQIMNYSFEAIWTANERGIIATYNQAAKKIFSSALDDVPSDFTGYDLSFLLPATLSEAIQEVFNSQKSLYNYVSLQEPFRGIFNITPVFEDEKTTSAIFHFNPSQEQLLLPEQLRKNPKGHSARYHFQDFITVSTPMKKILRNADQFAKYESNILLLGESGTGKELLSQSIHNASSRHMNPFVAINCGALPSNLLESELFGYVDGAFTGASKKGKKGLFEIADQGTIFLDEISEMDLNGQLKLLRVLEEREIMRIGSDQVIPINVRVITASNRNLATLVEEGSFRADLYYRLNVLTLNIPSLRERQDDILPIAEHFLEYYSQKYHKPVSFAPHAASALLLFHWPGNVRQLRNFCERLVIVAEDYLLSEPFLKEQLAQSYQLAVSSVPNNQISTSSPLLSEKEQLLFALTTANGSRTEAAQILGISTTTLWRKIKKYNL